MSTDLNICEGVGGTWHYHLRHGGSLTALCGAKVMRTSIPLDRWGKTPPNYHIPEHWCAKCNELRESPPPPEPGQFRVAHNGTTHLMALQVIQNRRGEAWVVAEKHTGELILVRDIDWGHWSLGDEKTFRSRAKAHDDALQRWTDVRCYGLPMEEGDFRVTRVTKTQVVTEGSGGRTIRYHRRNGRRVGGDRWSNIRLDTAPIEKACSGAETFDFIAAAKNGKS